MLSVVLRRMHMYAALLLCPWLLMYALSTLVMNHRAIFAPAPPYERERELTYDGVVPVGAPPRIVSEQLLESLNLNGAHSVTRRPDGAYVITRNDLISPRRLTYTPDDRRLVIERLPARAVGTLERFHRRRGYATGYGLDTLWAVSVDIAIAAMIFWTLSGLWLWWEMKAARAWGAAALLTGAALFGLYMVLL